MALKNKALTFIFLFIAPLGVVHSRIILPELLAKQALSNIRFLSREGKFTYYQKRSGSLLFSTNYKVQEVLKGEIGTSYNLFSTVARKKIIVLQNPSFNSFYSLRAKENIYILDYGENSPREVGKGNNPNLHLNDSWLSYYDSALKVLNFENTANAALKFSIKLNNRVNPYFIPMVVMSDDNTIYYTDLSETGNYGVLEFKRNTSKSEIIYKAPSPMMKAEICLNQDELILGTFGIHFSKLGTSISKIILPLKDFSKRESVYTSDLNDLGHLVCDFDKKNIAFIKNTGNINSPSFDISNINLNDKKLTPLSENHNISNIINMDGILLTQVKGKYFIVKGDVDFKNIDTLNNKPDSVMMKEKEIEAVEDDE